MRILVVDDVNDIRHLMRLSLEMKGHTVLEAEDGKQAISCALREHPDLILMDMNMPVMGGLAATVCIRENVETAMIPIMAVSAYMSDPVWRARALSCGCNWCFLKPLDMDALDGLLREMQTN